MSPKNQTHSDAPATAPSFIRITALDHVQLAMPPGREDDARRFYAGVLGMTEIPKPELLASRGGCWFQSGDAILHMGVEDPFAPARKAHPGICVTDLTAAAQALETSGYTVTFDDFIPELKRFHTSDPFGNRLEFMEAVTSSGNRVMYQVIYELNRDDAIRAAAFHYARRKNILGYDAKLAAIILSLILVLPLAFLVDNSKNQIATCMVLIVVGVCLVAAKVKNKRTEFEVIRRTISVQWTERAPTTFAILQRGIESDNGPDRGAWDWTGISFVAQTQQDIHIVSSLGESGIVPKRAFEASCESERAYAFLRSHIVGPWTCSYCKYDLTGNVTGRCPECNALA